MEMTIRHSQIKLFFSIFDKAYETISSVKFYTPLENRLAYKDENIGVMGISMDIDISKKLRIRIPIFFIFLRYFPNTCF